jgi:hypothetical protein
VASSTRSKRANIKTNELSNLDKVQ